MRALSAVLVLSGILLSASCDSMPDEAGARAALRAHRPSVDAVDTAIRGGLASAPSLTGGPVRCADPAAVAASGDPAQNAAFEVCHRRQAEQRTAADTAFHELSREPLLDLLDAHHDLLGIAVTVHSPGVPDRQATVGSTGFSREGTGAVTEGDHRVAENLYQTAVESGQVRAGDGEQRAGIEVSWTITEGAATVDLTTIILIDDQTDATWRSAQRQIHLR